MIAQADGHIQKITELVAQVSEDLIGICENAINSGKVNLGEYDNQEYILAKLLITAALYKVKDDYTNPHNPGFMREVKKIERSL